MQQPTTNIEHPMAEPSSAASQRKTDALFGGRLVRVEYEPTAEDFKFQISNLKSEEVRVRQISIRDYERGSGLLDDEIALVGFLCGREKSWAEALTPGSYEEVLRVGREVNAGGFFVYCSRRRETEQARQNEMLATMNAMPPDVLKMAFELGSKPPSNSTSPTPSPNPFARRA